MYNITVSFSLHRYMNVIKQLQLLEEYEENIEDPDPKTVPFYIRANIFLNLWPREEHTFKPPGNICKHEILTTFLPQPKSLFQVRSLKLLEVKVTSLCKMNKIIQVDLARTTWNPQVRRSKYRRDEPMSRSKIVYFVDRSEEI